MTAWLPVAVVAAAQVALQLVRVIGLTWHEREIARSRCDQMRAAAAGDVMLYEQRADGTGLMIIPQRLAAGDCTILRAAGPGKEAPGDG